MQVNISFCNDHCYSLMHFVCWCTENGNTLANVKNEDQQSCSSAAHCLQLYALLLFIAVQWFDCVNVQMNDATFVECCEMIANCLSLYQKQPTRTPRLRLSWSVSRRTLHKMRPSTRAAQDLEPIMEDESLRTSFSNDENDSSPFDR